MPGPDLPRESPRDARRPSRRSVLVLGLLAASLAAGWTFRRATESSRAARDAALCRDRLARVAWAKQRWASSDYRRPSDRPSPDDLVPFLAGSPARCPTGSPFRIGDLREAPRCECGRPGHEFDPALMERDFLDDLAGDRRPSV